MKIYSSFGLGAKRFFMKNKLTILCLLGSLAAVVVASIWYYELAVGPAVYILWVTVA